MSECPCCDGRTDFDWFMDACDECAEGIISGDWGEHGTHPHALSDAQREATA